MSKEFEEELFLPCGEFHFARDRAFVRVGSQDVEGHASEDGKVLRRVVFTGSGVVFVEDDVERPVKIVLDAPIGSHGLSWTPLVGPRMVGFKV